MTKNLLTIVRRELGAYFNSAIAYIYLIVFIAVNNSLFMMRYFLMGRADMRAYFDILPIVLLIFIPVITMRLWAEDRREHTFELLMTLPLRPAELVLGKFFAGFAFYAIALATTFTVPLIVFLTGQPDPGGIVGGYLGALLTGFLFLAIGIFVSGLVNEQIVAFVITTLSCFVLHFLGLDFTASLLDGWVAGLGTFLSDNIGLAAHLTSFTKGVVDVKDMLYFLVAGAVFLFLNGLFLEGRMRPKARLIFSAAAGLSLIGFVLFNGLIRDLPVGRFDITQDKMFTVSAPAKKILSGLKAPVQVKLYITPVDKMPTALRSLEGEIAGKLQELKIVSAGKFDYKVYHIEAARLLEEKEKKEPQEAASDSAPSLEKIIQEKGITPYQVESIDRDELGVKLVYSALTITYKEKPEEVLPRILPQAVPDLEYLLFSRILKMSVETRPKIAVFSPLKTQETTPEMDQLLSQMGETRQQYMDEYESLVGLMRNNGYDAWRIGLTKDDRLPEGVNTLLVLNPGPLNDRQLFEINKYLYQGGSVLLAAQAYEYGFQAVPPSGLNVIPQKMDLSVNRLLSKWGLSINEEVLMDESQQVLNIGLGQRVGPFAVSMPVKLPNQVIVAPDSMNKNMPFVTRLPSLVYLWGSALDVSDDVLKSGNIKKTLMFSSSDRSWKVPVSETGFNRAMLEFPKSGSKGRFPLAVMLEGEFSNTFAQGALPAWPSKEVAADAAVPPAAPAQEQADMGTPKPGRLILIGCAKMFSDDLLPQGGNLSLLSNIIDGLTLGEDLIKIRSVSYLRRDLKRVTDRQKVLYRFLTVFLVPVLLAIFAFLRIVLRQKEKQFYLMARER
jgi:ABC-type uncharacterized transport system involved in gliding motility auxiliary subunit/ABC-type transport system involved in multi-copper enzyme maturation permease subunit